jgi:hypothetical protein
MESDSVLGQVLDEVQIETEENKPWAGLGRVWIKTDEDETWTGFYWSFCQNRVWASLDRVKCDSGSGLDQIEIEKVSNEA